MEAAILVITNGRFRFHFSQSVTVILKITERLRRISGQFSGHVTLGPRPDELGRWHKSHPISCFYFSTALLEDREKWEMIIHLVAFNHDKPLKAFYAYQTRISTVWTWQIEDWYSASYRTRHDRYFQSIRAAFLSRKTQSRPILTSNSNNWRRLVN